jgi:hypothetical protein
MYKEIYYRMSEEGNEYNIDINNPVKIRLPALVNIYEETIEYYDGGIQTEYDKLINVFFINKRNNKYQIDSDLTSDIVFKLKFKIEEA